MVRGLRATIDPDDAPLVLDSPTGDGPIRVIGMAIPGADDEVQWVGSASTEGERPASARSSNQSIPLRLRIAGSGDTDEDRLASFADAQRQLDQKVLKLRKEGGVLRLEFPGFDTIDWTIVAVTGGERLLDNRFMRHNRTEDELTFICLPGGRGQEYEVPLTLERSTPCLITEPFEVRGDMEAFGRLVLRNESDSDVRWLRWGRESRNLSTAATAQLHYDATDLVPLGAAAVRGDVVRHSALVPGWLALLSIEGDDGAPMTHLGAFEVRLRTVLPTTNVGEVQLALEWWTGDGTAVVENGTAIFSADHTREGEQINVSLGEVYPRATASGSSSWGGRIIARSSAFGDAVDLVDLELIPLSEGSGTLAAVERTMAPSQVVAGDPFTSYADGDLAGQTSPNGGGRWLDVDIGGSTGAIQVSRGIAYRSQGSYRLAVLSTIDLATIDVSARIRWSTIPWSGRAIAGVVARYVDRDNFMAGWIDIVSGGVASVLIAKWIGGVGSAVARATLPAAPADWVRYRLVVADDGSAQFLMDGAVKVTATDPDFTTGGALARGSAGILDYSGIQTSMRYYTDLLVATGTSAVRDAAIFGGKELVLRHDSAEREFDGTWGRVSDIRNDYLRLAPAGVEQRSNRIIVVPCAGDPDVAPDSVTYDMTASLFVTPRYRTIPDLG